MWIQAALNGRRSRRDHPAVPETPAQIATGAAAAVAAGAGAIHVHVRDEAGVEDCRAEPVARVVVALRAACPGVPVGVSTGLWMTDGDAPRRLARVETWRNLAPAERPDYASVNLGEEGAVELMGLLLELGVGIEAGVAVPEDVRLLAGSAPGPRCLRLLMEPMETDPQAALDNVQAMNEELQRAGLDLPILLHGIEEAAWPVLAEAHRRDWDIRIGLEDTLRLPNGEQAAGNGELVGVARELVKA